MTDSSTKPSSDMLDKSKRARLMLQKDVRARWTKFSEIDVGALTSEADLVSQVVVKYSLNTAKAQSDVTALLKGRKF